MKITEKDRLEKVQIAMNRVIKPVFYSPSRSHRSFLARIDLY